MTERCWWCGDDPLYTAYHDTEWGYPIADDRKLFECLLLESAQAGLSWITILRKREGYRQRFANFDPEKIARFGDREIAAALEDAGIVRHRGKIEASIGNAKAFLAIQAEFGSFAKYLWAFVDNTPVQNQIKERGDIPSSDDTAKRLSKDLKKRGFKFVGPSITYAFMQATGMVNDHLMSCPSRKPCEQAAKAFTLD